MIKKSLRESQRVAVIGGHKPDNESLKIAYETGRLLAEQGAILICGGLTGIMEAAARGAKEAGGLTIGILPGTRLEEANPFIDLSLATGIGFSRNSLVVLNAGSVIAIDGEYGTLSEIAFARIYNKKVIGINTWKIEGVIPASSAREAVDLALAVEKE
ncbi:MAG: TIGR00725 family protein [Acidobacteriota bacterium]|nr:TIGR00725 family protein [Acidobacteriota bacterium]